MVSVEHKNHSNMDELNAFKSGRTTLKNHKNNMDDVNKGNSFIEHITCSTLNEE